MADSDKGHPWSLVVGLAGAVLCALLGFWGEAPPAALPANAAPELFSAERAVEELRILLGDEQPHPAGSSANHQVRERLVARLEAQGLEVEVQRAVGCIPQASAGGSAGPVRCAFVENVIGTLPGRRSDALVLLSHYDSVAAGPGAGDDGAGVAAWLEVLRVVRRGGPYENTLRFVFTDAEELGLLGAEAYFGQHPSADDAKAVLNLEASGSTGASQVLRPSLGSGALLGHYQQLAAHPRANSLVLEVFKRMPNDTDFSVAMRAGKRGIDFAFAGERNHYHKPLDDLAHLDPRSVQHHGENVLPLTLVLANADLDESGEETAYLVKLGLWSRWPESASLPIALAALLLLFGYIWRRREHAGLARSAAGLGVVLLAWAAVVLTNLGALAVAKSLAGAPPPWPANAWAWATVMCGATCLGWLVVLVPLAARVGLAGLWNGCWLLLATLAVAIATVAPLAVHIFVIPSLVAGFVAVGVSFFRRKQTQSGSPALVTLVPAWVGALYLGPFVILMELQGYHLAPAMYVPGGLTFLLLSPLVALAPRRQLYAITTGAALVVLAGLVGLATTSLYDEMRPQKLNIFLVEGLAAERETRQSHLAVSSLPPRLAELAEFEPAHLFPWNDKPTRRTTPVAGTEAPPPELEVVRERKVEGGRELVLRLRSPRGANVLRLRVAQAAQPIGAQIEGQPVRLGGGGQAGAYARIDIYAVPPQGVELTLKLGSDDVHQHHLADTSYGLAPPELAQRLARARGATAVPGQWGDVWHIHRPVSF